MMTSIESQALKIGYQYSHIELKRSKDAGQWLNPYSNTSSSVEAAALGHFRLNGWRGFSYEGGLLLNLIKAASFRDIPDRLRSTYVEAIYAHNLSQAEDKLPIDVLLDNISRTDPDTILKNYRFMASNEPLRIRHTMGDVELYTTSTTSMLSYFPALDEWMFSELFDVLGTTLLRKLAHKFSEDPYEYRKGWPDLTIWKEGQLQFVEVKAPGDRISKSQQTILREFGAPFELNFQLLEVKECLNT